MRERERERGRMKREKSRGRWFYWAERNSVATLIDETFFSSGSNFSKGWKEMKNDQNVHMSTFSPLCTIFSPIFVWLFFRMARVVQSTPERPAGFDGVCEERKEERRERKEKRVRDERRERKRDQKEGETRSIMVSSLFAQ
jgi:hypothetical protein